MPVLVAPSAFGGALRAPVVAAAIGRGLERAGVSPPPDLCPVAGGGRGTIEVLLPALGGETGDGFALIEDGATAIVEAAPAGRSADGETAIVQATPGGREIGDTAGIAEALVASRETGAGVARAIDAGAEVVLVAAGGLGAFDGGAGVVEAIENGGGLRGAVLVVLCETRAAWGASHRGPSAQATSPDPRRLRAAAGRLPRDPRGVAMTAAGGGLAGALWAHYGAQLVPGSAFVLEQLDFDARMRSARAVIVGEARLDRTTLSGRVAGEAAIRARQAGVPCHAIVGSSAIDRFDARILDVQAILEADTIKALAAAGQRLADWL